MFVRTTINDEEYDDIVDRISMCEIEDAAKDRIAAPSLNSVAVDAHRIDSSTLDAPGVTAQYGDAATGNQLYAGGTGSLSSDVQSRLQELGALHATRFEAQRGIADVSEAISLYRRACECLSDGDPTKAACLERLGVLFWHRFDLCEEVEDLKETAAAWRQAVILADPTATDRTSSAIAFFARLTVISESGVLQQSAAGFSFTTDSARLKAQKLLPKVADVLPAPRAIENRDIRIEVDRLVDALVRYIELRGYVKDVDEKRDAVVAVRRCAVVMTPDGHRLKPQTLYILGRCLLQRFDVHELEEDLREGLACFCKAHSLGIPPRVPVVINFAHALSLGFTRLDSSESHGLGNMLHMLHHAVNRVPDENPEKADCFGHLAEACMFSFGRHKNDKDLDRATAARQAAVRYARTPQNLSSLGVVLQRRCLHFAQDNDIRDSIALFTEAIELSTPAGDVGFLASLYLNRAFAYHTKFNRSRQPADESAAVADVRHATVLDVDHLPQLLAVAGGEQDLYRIDEAIGLLGQQIARTRITDTSSDRVESEEGLPTLLTTLARCFVLRYHMSHQHADRERAEQEYRKAHGAAQNDSDKLSALNELVEKLMFWDQDPLPATDPDAPALVKLLGLTAQAIEYTGAATGRYKAAKAHARLTEKRFRRLAEAEGESGFERFSHQIIDPWQRVIDLIPQLASEQHTLSRRYEEIARLTSDANHAINLAVYCREPISLKWFEQCRALVWGQIRNLRTRAIDVSQFADLGPEHKHLAQRLETLSASLEAAAQQDDKSVLRRRLADERRQVLGQLRTIEGFASFLQPMEFRQLRDACMKGAVCITMHANQCHAIMRYNCPEHGYEVKPFCLDITPRDAQQWRMRLNLSLNLHRAARDSGPAPVGGDARDTQAVLRELWTCIVKPILHRLEVNTESYPSRGEQLPRVTWCTTGALSFLPLHAAGRYEGGRPNAFDLVVSSYTPNLATILSEPKLRGRTASKPSLPKILIVAQPSVKGYRKLPGTRTEASNIQEIFLGPDSSTVLEESAGTVEEVLSQMKTHPYVHLACHGEQHDENPLQSAFILHNGRLTLERLMETSSNSGELAFLSACETATGDKKIPDEAVHLAAGMLAAGYRSVVATMWSIGDSHAPLVAKEFYATLLAQHAAGETDVARALHKAVTSLKKELEKEDEVGDEHFAKWVPFVHFGI
ncbi:hypothetical protein EXIGLDRAFT_656668 [Exidia glandulosa HHB12029]|uniref:CHAT domain-containing protein n=1 Tax=Exidia glandulosa HHB12029 TaxID=1314781 RepID=A0A165CQP2_EXIGL|nr:hypothetical protein EXIGLDRAFT_656668 [Exidia glandulosa HHB12029]